GWEDYFTKGYIPYGDTHERTAKTLEYAYDDFCAYQLAKSVGNRFYEQVFARQIYNYRHVFDLEVNFVRRRRADGTWRADFDAVERGGAFAEANRCQCTCSVMHDVIGLSGLIGGEARFNAKLDSFFTMEQRINCGTYGKEIHEMKEMLLANMGQYAHGNQPTQHVPYLYTFSGQPWKTQERVRRVMAELYNATEKGYPGDEDQGQMSSWYVLSALGLYSVCPGTDQYVIGSPVFERATITLEDGKRFTVRAVNNGPENVYIRSARLNGEVYDKNYLTYSDIVAGGELELIMDSTPNYERGTAEESRPFSLTKKRIN